MAQLINLTQISKDDLFKTVGEFCISSNQDLAESNKLFLSKNNGYYVKIVNEDCIYIGKFSVTSCENQHNKYISYGSGFMLYNMQCLQSDLLYCDYSTARISVLKLEEYFEISNYCNNLLQIAQNIRSQLLTKYEKTPLINITKLCKYHKPDRNNLFQINATDSFIKKNKNVSLFDIYTALQEKYTEKFQSYINAFEKGKELVGKYYIDKDGIGEILQVKDKDIIQIYGSLIITYDKVFSYKPLTIMCCNCHEIIKEDFMLIKDIQDKFNTLFNKVKS